MINRTPHFWYSGITKVKNTLWLMQLKHYISDFDLHGHDKSEPWPLWLSRPDDGGRANKTAENIKKTRKAEEERKEERQREGEGTRDLQTRLSPKPAPMTKKTKTIMIRLWLISDVWTPHIPWCFRKPCVSGTEAEAQRTREKGRGRKRKTKKEKRRERGTIAKCA